MSLTLICLHGFAQHGAYLAAAMTELSKLFDSGVQLVCPDAPHGCSAESLKALDLSAHTPPHLCWWEENADGSVYRGWELTCEQLRELCDRTEAVGVLGFGQGATATAAIAGLSAGHEFPPLAFVVLIGGSLPRADLLRPHFQAPTALSLPSLHIVPERDAEATKQAALVSEAFAPAARESVSCPDLRAVPAQGAAADAIVRLVNQVNRGA